MNANHARNFVRRAVGPLRRRFFYLLALIAIVSVLPVALSVSGMEHQQGFALQLEAAGSLRFRMSALQTTLSHPRDDAVAIGEREQMLARQRETLVRLISGDGSVGLPACRDPAICARLRMHLDRLDHELAPALRADHGDRVVLDRLLDGELAALDATVHQLARVREGHIVRLIAIDLGVAGGALALIVLVAYGTWEVFSRIRLLDEASQKADAEREVLAQAGTHDEVARLARSLGASLRAERERNEADLLRLERLRVHQKMLQRLAADLNAWVAGQGTLDEALSRIKPAGDPGVTETVERMISSARLARRLLDEQELRSGLYVLLGRSSTPEEILVDLGGILRRLVPHQRAFLLLSDGQCHELDEHGACSIAAMPELSPERALHSALCVEGRQVGLLALERDAEPFSPDEASALAPVLPVLASAFARMDLAARLRVADRMAIVGGMGRLLAHDLRNPLNNLILQATVLERRCHDERIPMLRADAERVSDLVDGFLRLTSESDEPLDEVDLRQVVEAAVKRHGPLLEDLAIDVDLDAGTRPAIAPVDRARIEEVLDELIENAAHAMARRATRRLSIHLGAHNGAWEIRVHDSGPGLPDPESVFHPTRKNASLALSQQIARLHRGELRATNHPEGGAEFILTLARTQPIEH